MQAPINKPQKILRPSHDQVEWHACLPSTGFRGDLYICVCSQLCGMGLGSAKPGVGKPRGRFGRPPGAPSQGLVDRSTSAHVPEKDESGVAGGSRFRV